MVSDNEFVVICGFFILLMVIAWIMSCYWANKYNKLQQQIDDGKFICIDKVQKR